MMSSSANPRKFSEKIAIQQRKLNEEQSAFQQIMHEVHTITRFPTPVAAQALGAPGVSWNQRVAGSLPNVFEIAYRAQAQRPDLQAFANPLLYANQWPGTSAHPNTAAAAQLMVQTNQPNAQCPVSQSPVYLLHQQHSREIGQPSGYQRSSHQQHAVHRGRSPGSHPHYHPYRTPSPHHSPVGSAVGSPNLRARSPDRPQLTPPCQSASYLVPPQDSGWRRTHSDPGIHASVTDPNVIGQNVDGQLSYPSSAMNHMDSSCNSPNIDVNMSNAYLDPKLNLYYPGVLRSKPDDPGINMQTLNINPGDLSAGSSQASISSNTGSLPDLTQVPPSTMGQPPTNLPNPPPQHHQQQPLHYSQSLGYGQSSSTSAAMSTGFHPTGVNSDLGSLSGIGGPTVSHQQRHSIQLPVQYAQGHFAGVATTGNPSLYSFPGSQSSSPGYQADSPHSGPNSPATTANSESPSNASQQGQSSPGSPYYSLPAQLQNINIEASDFQPQQSVYISGDGSGQQQLQFRVPVNPNSTNQYQQMNCSTQYQIRTNMVTPPPYQPPNNKIAQQQPCEIYGQIQPPLPSPNSGKIPNIILTGPCDTNAASTSVTFVDPAVAMLSSNLRLTLDPSDLESLQVLSNEHDLIDADTEDALRGDRV